MNKQKNFRLMRGRLMAGAAAFALAFAGMAQAKDKIDVGDMPHFCQNKAAKEFGVNASDVSTLPAEHDKGKYVVYGQTPAEGQNALFFTCKFDADRKFDKVVKQSDSRAHAQSGGASHSHGVNLSDLKGMNSIKAFDEMTSRGFTSVDSITSGNTIYGIYYNHNTRQCIQLTNADNKVYEVTDIHTHPKCH